LLKIFKSLLNGLEFKAVILDGLPFDGVEVSSLDQLSEALVKLNGAEEAKDAQDDGKADWEQDYDFKDTLDKGVVSCGFYCLREINIKVNLRKGFGVYNRRYDPDGLIE
jgi:hypothetical protein